MKRIVFIAIFFLFPLVLNAQPGEDFYKKGNNYYFGINGVKQDYKEAIVWYRKAAEHEQANAQYYLGLCYEKGQGVTKNETEAIEWYRKAAEQGHAIAQYSLGNFYRRIGSLQDYTEAVKWYLKAAEQDHAVAQIKLGFCYEEGKGVAQDYTQAVEWYRKAAEQGHDVAQFYLGNMYYKGLGVPQSYTEALKWYQEAAEQGFASAQYNLGTMYDIGQGVANDYTEAVKWYRKAAEQGHAGAQNNLGVMYEKGQGVAKDYTEAIKWYRKAAEQGHAGAQNNLGVMYEKGQGVAKDYTEAIKWYRKAAEQGNKNAMRNIGLLYENGEGVTQNYQTAKEWFQKAINKDPNYSNAKNSLARVEEIISKQQKQQKKQKKDRKKNETLTDNTPIRQTVATTIEMPDVDKNIPHATKKNSNLLAVIIGNEKYSKLPDVPFAENDAKMFKEYCEKTLGAKEKNIRYLPNAGYVDIRDAVNWLKEGANSYSGEACVIFYYAGHGLPDPNTGSQYLLPADVDGKYLDLTVSLQKLYDDFGKMPARSVTVFLDACFSGTNRDNKMVAANSGARLAFAKSKIGTPTGKTVIFSATEEDQTAHPFKDRKHGFFTYFLLRKLQESKGEATLGEIADYVTKNVKRAVFDEIETSQTPSVKPSGNFANNWRNIRLK